jgi:hypothetical protein
MTFECSEAVYHRVGVITVRYIQESRAESRTKSSQPLGEVGAGG